jgi:hypothetical protein
LRTAGALEKRQGFAPLGFNDADENPEIQRGNLGIAADRAILEACDDVPLSARGRVA